MSDDPYRVLGVDRRATAEDVRQAYFRLVRRYAPEAHPEEIKAVRAAYEALRSPLRPAELSLLGPPHSVPHLHLHLAPSPENADLHLAAVVPSVELSPSDLA